MKELLKTYTEDVAKLGRVESIKHIGNKSSIVSFKKILIPEKISSKNISNFIGEAIIGYNNQSFYFLLEDVYALTVNFKKTGTSDRGTAELLIELLNGDRESNIKTINDCRELAIESEELLED
jgi:hypothetical protein